MQSDRAAEHVGRHCEYADCGQLDFLPNRCSRCGRTFCADHRSISAHACTAADGHAAPVPVASGDGRTVHEVLHPDRPAPQLQYGRGEVLVPGAAAAVERQAAAAAAAPAAKKRSPQLELMKIKARAQGEASVPMERRVYVHMRAPAPASASLPMFFDLDATAGRVLDRAAAALGVDNVNNRGSAPPERLLSLAHGDTHERLEPSRTLREAGLQHGETLALVRGRQN